ncbi:MAG: MBL fold metallo-hydrolase [Desulfobacterales bacterium]|nr:MAG: MBL fold metallo-hydrolase [Desulfobacterales bacterium]
MKITFYGAVREVTGSMHLLTTNANRILLDCGMFQGRRKDTAQKNRSLPFNPQGITSMVLSHAHIDHSGRIPLLIKNNFTGRIVCTRATHDACEYLLLDAAHIQESDAEYLNYKTVRSYLYQKEKAKNKKKSSTRKHNHIKKLLKKEGHQLDKDKIDELVKKHNLHKIRPLYTIADAEQALKFFDGYPYRHSVNIGKEITLTFYEAGHILGSAISMIKTHKNGRSYTIGYTGDIGRFNKPIIKDPALYFEAGDREIDLLIMESTYGNRVHEPVQDLKPQLKKVLTETFERDGTVIIPAFAYGRTQELLYILHELYEAGDIQRVPVFVDSPLATKITRVFGEHPEVYDHETHETFLEKNKNPFSFDQIRFVGSVDESMALNRDERSHIVIAASGMCEAGRVLHHLRHKIHNPKHTILIVGYMAQNTLGRRILEQGLAYETSGRKGLPPVVKFLNKEYPLKAHVVKLGGFSAHGDRNEMIQFLNASNLRVKKIALVHGEEDQSLSFARYLENEGFAVVVPQVGETMEVK